MSDLEFQDLHERLKVAEATLKETQEALEELRINANRLCDRQLGGSYEDDCRRSLKRAEVALSSPSLMDRATRTVRAEMVNADDLSGEAALDSIKK